MPKRRRHVMRRRPRRRRRRRRRRRNKRRLTAGGFPIKKLVRLKYVQQFQLDPAAGGFTSFQFYANGLYQPPVSAPDHQPLTFDQWMSIYTQYAVVGSKITVEFVNAGSASAPLT